MSCVFVFIFMGAFWFDEPGVVVWQNFCFSLPFHYVLLMMSVPVPMVPVDDDGLMIGMVW
jgi:hypothetical protein